MRRTSPWVGGLLVLALFLPAFAADEKQESTPQKEAPATASPKEKTPKPKPFTYGLKFPAKLLRIESKQHTLTVEVKYKGSQVNTDAVRSLTNLRRQLIGNRDPNSIRNIYIEMAKNEQNLFKTETEKIELQPADDLKVRTRQLPLETDEKGKPRRLTEKEKRELKGPDPKLPGYTADFDSLKPDQQVEVYLEKSAKNMSQQKLKDLAAAKEKPKAVMIVILAEPMK